MSVRVALETSTPVGSVAVGGPEGVRAEVTLRIEEMHSEVLMPALDFALATAGVARAQVRELVIGVGPGSFTGVRIAAAVAKGWWFATDAGLWGYPSTLALAADAGAAEGRPVCGLLDARRGEVYAAGYRFGAGRIEELFAPTARAASELAQELARDGLRALCVGPGAAAYRSELEAHGHAVPPGPTAWPRARTLLWLRERWPEGGTILDPSRWEPLYVRDSGARVRHEPAG